MTTRIQTGATEPVEVTRVDSLSRPVTGLTNLLVKVRRLSNDEHFDWNDNNFKASPTQLYLTMIEINATLSPGEYHLNTSPHVRGFDTSEIINPTADDAYHFTVVQGTGAVADPIVYQGEVKVGHWVDFIDEAISDQATPAEVQDELRAIRLHHLVAVNPGAVTPAAGTYIKQALDLLNKLDKIESGRWKIDSNQMVFYDSDGTTPLLTFDLKDDVGNATETNVYERVPV